MPENFSIEKRSLEFILGQWTERFTHIEGELKKHNGQLEKFAKVLQEHTSALSLPIENKEAIAALRKWREEHEMEIKGEEREKRHISISMRNAILAGVGIALITTLLRMLIDIFLTGGL